MAEDLEVTGLRKGYSPSAFHQVVEFRLTGVTQTVSVNVNVKTKTVVEVAGIPEDNRYDHRRAFVTNNDKLINYAVACY